MSFSLQRIFKRWVYAVSLESSDAALSTIYVKFTAEMEKVENAFELESVFQIMWVLFQELHSVGLREKKGWWLLWLLIPRHPRVMAAKATRWMRLNTAPNRKKPQNLNMNQGKHCLGRLSTTARARWPQVCVLVLPTYQRAENKKYMSFSAVLEDAQMSVHSMTCHSHRNIKQLVFYTVINQKLNTTAWLLYLLVSNDWYSPQVWDPLSHSSYPSNQVAMGDHNSFGNSCGSACVHDHCDIRGHRPGWLLVSCKLLKKIQSVMCGEPLRLGDLTHWHISAVTAIQHHRTLAITFCFCFKRLWSSWSGTALSEQYLAWLSLSTTTSFPVIFPLLLQWREREAELCHAQSSTEHPCLGKVHCPGSIPPCPAPASRAPWQGTTHCLISTNTCSRALWANLSSKRHKYWKEVQQL